MGICCSKDAAVHAAAVTSHALRESSASSTYSARLHALGKTAPAADAQGLQPATPTAVKVAVIVRPLLPFEQQKGGGSCVIAYPPNKVSLQVSLTNGLSPRPSAGTAGNNGAADFQYDRVYNAIDASVNRQMYQDMVSPVIERFCQGYNASVLVYGQTGSGKTYQMGGPSSMQEPYRISSGSSGKGRSKSSNSSVAIIPQACAQLLEYIQGAKAVYDVQLKISYVEIYNEAIQDLLSPSAAVLAAAGSNGNLAAARAVHGSGGSSSSIASSVGSGGGSSPLRTSPSAYALNGAAGAGAVSGSSGSCAAVAADGSSGGSGGGSISVYENAAGQIVMDGATEVSVSSLSELAGLLERGGAVRATAAHKLNQNSSRSHAILIITLQQRAHPANASSLAPELRCLCSKLHLVDLAGSERAKETGTTGARFAEGVSINKGLLELGNVINALTEGASRKHIPYRNSKLTRLLQDSLGGNSETLFIACISPAESNRDHTISTLRYASRAMSIKNAVRRSTMGVTEELAYLRELVNGLQEENARLRKLAGEAGLLKGNDNTLQSYNLYVQAS